MPHRGGSRGSPRRALSLRPGHHARRRCHRGAQGALEPRGSGNHAPRDAVLAGRARPEGDRLQPVPVLAYEPRPRRDLHELLQVQAGHPGQRRSEDLQVEDLGRRLQGQVRVPQAGQRRRPEEGALRQVGEHRRDLRRCLVGQLPVVLRQEGLAAVRTSRRDAANLEAGWRRVPRDHHVVPVRPDRQDRTGQGRLPLGIPVGRQQPR